MSKKEISELIIETFNNEKYQKALEFPNNKINIISFRESPLKLRVLLLDNDREFHLIIDEKRMEIFHDCPTFLIKINQKEKICPHLIKILLVLDPQISKKIISNLNEYSLSSEDFNSEKKSKSYLKLAQSCFQSKNCLDGLNYLNKIIMNQRDCGQVIERYLRTSLENELYIEFFAFLKQAYENELADYLLLYNNYIQKGLSEFLNIIPQYSFFNLLRIIESIDSFLDHYAFQDADFLTKLIISLRDLLKSEDFNQRYFAIFFVKKNLVKINKLNPNIKMNISDESLNHFKNEVKEYFLDQIENFCSLEKLKLIKKQMQVFEIPENLYKDQYAKYKNEIKELERKVYLKKFAYLKLLIEKHGVKRSKVDFRKQRNTYIVTHDKENLQNPAYKYIISHIGFFGLNNSRIKSSDIGINYLIIKELFNDDLTNFPDIFYYNTQFWGDNGNYEINQLDGYSLISKSIDYSYDMDQISFDIDRVILVEWDLANKPRQGSLVNAYGSQIIIPDQNNPLFHDLKPFDLCYCQKNPVKIEANIIKSVNILKKCSFNDAIHSVAKGMEFLEGYYPLSFVRSIIDKTINPFEAYDAVINNPNKLFIPNFSDFISAFQEFLFSYISKEKEYVFNQILSSDNNHVNKFLVLLNLKTELSGMNLPYNVIIKDLVDQDIPFKYFRRQLLKKIHNFVRQILEVKELGKTRVFDLKKMQHTPFVKYISEINRIRKNEFENSAIYETSSDKNPLYNLSTIVKTYYGEKIADMLNLGTEYQIEKGMFKRFQNYALKLNLDVKIQESDN
jgi:hypothetical protein